MRDSLASSPRAPELTDTEKAEALHALGAFYVRQGYAAQGLSLLRASERFGGMTPALKRALAHALLAADFPVEALSYLDEIEAELSESLHHIPAQALRAQALLALDRPVEARAAFRAGRL